MSSGYYVGEWLVEPEQNRLVRGTQAARLDPKAIQVLSFLARHPNEVLTKEQIIGSVWEGAFVSDEVLTTAIWGLRKALGDDAKEPRYIQTIPRRGYRLIAPVEGASAEPSRTWEPSPYPGLSPFSQRDARFFFGREQEVEALWKKLHERNLLALIGPSGAGKSSLLRAGVIPTAPEGWGVVLCQPRTEAFESLSSAMDGRRDEYREALWIVDQFEELFTLHDEETQKRFAELLGRAADSGVHVILSMRDDFLIRCHDHLALAPIFEKVTPVKAPEGAALRRALTEPARVSGYRFEDEALMAEILTEVSRERGALPLLAFTASKLWEKRDRERRLITREAYLAVGQVVGALAKHAEETLSTIGSEHEPTVREIFRNLTTASGTRVPMDREELLTVFRDRETVEGVLAVLIDARLLTSARREVEVIHESLVSAWPRLVRWRAQDAEGAVLRDQLRQAARAWQERGRPDDLLWTGRSYRELSLWRESYTGGLSSTEESFAWSAARLVGRRRRMARLAAGALVAAALGVAAMTSSLWRQAKAEALRAEAAELLSLGRLRLEDHPTEALAFATASLERADTDEARRFALAALWRGAAAFVLPMDVQSLAFSPDGRWLASAGHGLAGGVRLWSQDGGPPLTIAEPEGVPEVGFGSVSNRLVIADDRTLQVVSLPEGKQVGKLDLQAPFWRFWAGRRAFTFTPRGTGWTVLSLPFDAGEVEIMGTWNDGGFTVADVSQSDESLVYARDRTIYRNSLRNLETSAPRILGQHDSKISWVSFETSSDRVVTADEDGEIRIWAGTRAIRTILGASTGLVLDMDADGSILAAGQRGNQAASDVTFVWDLNGPPDAEPAVLRNGDVNYLHALSVDRQGLWLATAYNNSAVLWPLRQPRPRVLRGQLPPWIDLAFTPDGQWLASSSSGGGVRLWPLSSTVGSRHRVFLAGREDLAGLAMDPTGGNLVVTQRFERQAFVIPLDQGEPRTLPRFTSAWLEAPAFSSDGRRVAAPTRRGPKGNLVELWDLDSWTVRALDPRTGDETCNDEQEFEGLVWRTAFTSDGRLLTAGVTGLRVWDLETGTSTLLRPCRWNAWTFLASSPVDRFLLAEYEREERTSVLSIHDLRSHVSRELTSHGNRVRAIALDPKGELVVTGDLDGVVRVGPATGEEPHLLYGHTGEVWSVAVSPDGKWIASGSQDGTIRLWPMPDGPPFHTLPYEEILERLRALTNLRIVSEEGSGRRYSMEIGSFPGWKNLPNW